jgi:fructosamine-3-kinase
MFLGDNTSVRKTFIKHRVPGDPGSLQLEALGLRWLAEASRHDGVRVARVLGVSDNHLELERLALAGPAQGAGEAFGRALAHTHAAGAPWYGAAPPGWSGPGSIGRAPLQFVTAADDAPTWGCFYARYRLWPYARVAERLGALPPEAMSVFSSVCERLESGLFDSPQPALVGGVARLHGDLWAGNVLWSPPLDDSPTSQPWTGAVVIDPAAQGGHAETDLAMLALFGVPQLEAILAAYDETSALADDWTERIGLHQLHPLLVHAALFGGTYGDKALEKARAYL